MLLYLVIQIVELVILGENGAILVVVLIEVAQGLFSIFENGRRHLLLLTQFVTVLVVFGRGFKN
jgi:hypothetical protein